VLLERPAAIHALLATARAPAAEAAARACTAAASWSGGSSSATRDPAGRRPALLFQRLLDASLSALSAVATSLDKVKPTCIFFYFNSLGLRIDRSLSKTICV
jgi:hypothetical protein